MLMYNLMKYYVIHVINTLFKLNHICMDMTEYHGGFKPVFEEKESINFLNLPVIRKKENMEIEIYRKPTNLCTPVHFTSNHPREHKLATY